MKTELDVYVLTYLPTQKKYVGKTGNLKNRIQNHISCLNVGHHPCKDLQADYNKYGGGRDAFRIEIAGKYKWHCGDTENDLEYKTMAALKTYDERYGYNTHDCVMQKLRKAEGLEPIYLYGQISRCNKARS